MNIELVFEVELSNATYPPEYNGVRFFEISNTGKPVWRDHT